MGVFLFFFCFGVRPLRLSLQMDGCTDSMFFSVADKHKLDVGVASDAATRRAAPGSTNTGLPYRLLFLRFSITWPKANAWNCGKMLGLS